jgi:LacI family transcriptional regulator
MNITIKDIARIANVSYATVSRALNNHKDVSDDTKRKILGICEQLGYSPNAIARGLVTKSTNTIGLLVPDITNPFFPEVARGVEDEASKRNYNVFLCNTNWDIMKEISYFQLLLGKRVEGIIIAPVSDGTFNLAAKYTDRLPIIFIASKIDDSSHNYIVIDDIEGVMMATEHLISLGHKKIAFIGGKEGTSTFKDRLEGYKIALENNGIKPDPELVKSYGYRKESGYNGIRSLVESSNMPTAIIAINDIVALGVIEAAEEIGLNIPDDVSLIGFDDIPYASLPKIKLTTISQPKYDMGRESVNMLFDKLSQENSKQGLHKVIKPRLIIRSTCKAI